MLWIGIISGGLGLAGSLFFSRKVDQSAHELYQRAKTAWRQLTTSTPAPHEDLLLVSRLISSLRSGLSLDSALELVADEASPSLRARIHAILEGKAASDFLSSFLGSALRSGCPALASLQSFERALLAKRKLEMKSRASSSQSRAQAEVLSWLPWALASALLLLDFPWFAQAAASPVAWALWAVSLALAGFGRQWIRFALSRALRPSGEQEQFEEEVLPELVLRILSELAQGQDVETASERVFLAFPASRQGEGARLQSLLRHSARTGAPLREDLLLLLENVRAETETRWEERVQRLPVALLGPLFLCFFPSSLLVLAGLLIPLLQGSI